MSGTKTYRIKEIFYSLQGEGYYTGRAAVFVRLAGCNLRCPFCDTDFAGGEEMTADEIVSQVLSLTCQSAIQEQSSLSDSCLEHTLSARPLLVLTGGEPSLQADEALVEALHKAGFYIAMETNGTHPLPEGIDWITCSPKDAPVVLTRADEVKVVYTGQDVERWYGTLEAKYYFLQPCDLSFIQSRQQVVDTQQGSSHKDKRQHSTLESTIAYILEHPHWRLSVQMHKLLGIR